MQRERAFAGISRSASVDETAITLKLRPVPRGRRERWLARWPMVAAATVAGLAAAATLVIDAPAAELAPRERIAAPSPRVEAVAIPPREAGPILASAATPIFESTEDIVIFDDEADEIVIFDEPVAPPPDTRATRRARARTSARNHVKAGETARRVGDLAAAERAFAAALTALPSYAPAAAGLAEIHMKRGSYRAGLGYAKRAFRAAPRKLDYMLLLGDAYSRTNNRAAAQKLWRRAMALGSPAAKSRLAG